MSSIVALVIGVIVGLLGVLVVGLLRSHAEILTALGPVAPASTSGRSDGAASDRAPDITGRTPTGSFRRVAVGSAPGRTLLAFLTSGCETCRSHWQALQGPLDLWPDTRVVVVTKGEHDESPPAVAALAPPGIVTVMSTEAWQDFDIPVAPYFVLVDGSQQSIVAEGAAGTWAQAREMLDKALRDATVPGRTVSRRQVLSGLRTPPDRADRELHDAGLTPGHPSLHPAALPAEDISS